MDLIKEIKEIIRQEIAKAIIPVNLPDNIEVDLKNVPVTKIEIPEIDLSGLEKALTQALKQQVPVVQQQKIDTTKLENIVQDFIDTFTLPDNRDSFAEIVKAINENKPIPFDTTGLSNQLEQLIKTSKTASGYQGGGIGPSKVWIKKKNGQVADFGSTVSTLNSSTTALNNSEVYTGTWEDVSQYDSLVVAVATDQDGTLTVQFSPDGTNQDSTLTRYYRTANINPPHRFTITRKFARITFTNNSGSNQTYFRLQTMLGDKADLNIPIDATMSQNYDSLSVRPTDFTTEVALGRRQGFTTWNKFGYNNDVDTATDPEIVASWGGAFAYITTGETLDVVSTSTADDGSPAGTGANSIVIYGVDQNWNPQTEVVTLNGTTTVTTTSQWIGINRISVYLAGSGKTNAGTINVTGTSSSTQLAQMPVGEGTSQQLIFYVPANHQFLATWLVLNALKEGPSTAPIVTFRGWVYSAVSNAEYEVYRGSEDTNATTDLILNPTEPFIVGEKSILWFTAETTQNDTVVRGRFSGKLVKDIDA